MRFRTSSATRSYHFHALLLLGTADTFGAFDAYEEYAELVTRWAQSVRETLDAELA